jgi:hypothetical protein
LYGRERLKSDTCFVVSICKTQATINRADRRCSSRVVLTLAPVLFPKYQACLPSAPAFGLAWMLLGELL